MQYHLLWFRLWSCIFLASAKTFPIIFWPCASSPAAWQLWTASGIVDVTVRPFSCSIRGAKQIPYNYICAVQKYDIIQHFINPHKVAKCEKARKNKSPSSGPVVVAASSGPRRSSSPGHLPRHSFISFRFIFYVAHDCVSLLLLLLAPSTIHNRAELLYFCTVSVATRLVPPSDPVCLRAHAVIHVRDVEK